MTTSLIARRTLIAGAGAAAASALLPLQNAIAQTTPRGATGWRW
ncbi:MAG: hypothetical protein JWQ72_2830 [Polaromonas sp.]|nr:hypothetical protein [Polaromonas sp.]